MFAREHSPSPYRDDEGHLFLDSTIKSEFSNVLLYYTLYFIKISKYLRRKAISFLFLDQDRRAMHYRAMGWMNPPLSPNGRTVIRISIAPKSVMNPLSRVNFINAKFETVASQKRDAGRKPLRSGGLDSS
jgi:hypothetical protein